MTVKVEKNQIVISIPISPRASKTGKTTVIASSQGNVPVPGVMYEGKQLVVGVNAYVKAD